MIAVQINYLECMLSNTRINFHDGQSIINLDSRKEMIKLVSEIGNRIVLNQREIRQKGQNKLTSAILAPGDSLNILTQGNCGALTEAKERAKKSANRMS